MPRLNRSYKKGAPHRDSRLFVIVAEGEREDNYFAFFNQQNSRIRVLTVHREQDASAPKHFVSRLAMAEESGEYTPESDDTIWFVCDTDRWGNQLNELKADCDQNENWSLAISNPCFEVWLHYHSGPLDPAQVHCSDLKTRLPSTSLGAFNTKIYCKEIARATRYAEQADTKPASDFPELMQTKVYKLAKQIGQVLGSNWL